jgi:hypothetical protein
VIFILVIWFYARVNLEKKSVALLPISGSKLVIELLCLITQDCLSYFLFRTKINLPFRIKNVPFKMSLAMDRFLEIMTFLLGTVQTNRQILGCGSINHIKIKNTSTIRFQFKIYAEIKKMHTLKLLNGKSGILILFMNHLKKLKLKINFQLIIQ